MSYDYFQFSTDWDCCHFVKDYSALEVLNLKDDSFAGYLQSLCEVTDVVHMCFVKLFKIVENHYKLQMS